MLCHHSETRNAVNPNRPHCNCLLSEITSTELYPFHVNHLRARHYSNSSLIAVTLVFVIRAVIAVKCRVSPDVNTP